MSPGSSRPNDTVAAILTLEPERALRPGGRFGMPSDRWPIIAVGIGVAALVILLLVIPDVFIPDTSLGWVDAWYDVSFALKLPERVARYPFLYQSERIAWTLPAYFFNRLASPLVANYCVKSLFFLATIFFLFASVREITGSVRTAGFVSALAAFHSFLVHSLGTSYVDGPMNAYVLGTLYFSTRAFLRTERIGSAFLAGAFFGCQLFTHLAALVLAPSLALYCALTWARAVRRGPHLRLILIGIASGFGAVAVGVCLLYLRWQPGTFPLQQSIRFLFDPTTANPLVLPFNDTWVRSAFWLLLPTAVVIWILVAIVRALRVRWSAPLRLPAAFWWLISAYGCWVALYALHQPWLMLPFYSSYLIPPTFLALGPIAARSVEGLSAGAYKRVLMGLFACSAAGYWLSNARIVEASVIVALACLGAATLLRLRWRWHSSPAFAMLLVGAGASINCATVDYGAQLRNGYAQTSMMRIYRSENEDLNTKVGRAERFEAAIDAADQLERHLSGNSGRSYFFWYDGHDPLGMFYRSVTSLLFAWSTSHLLGEDFCGFNEENLETLSKYDESGMRDLVVLTRSAHISPPDDRFTIRWTDREEVGGIAYYAHYLEFEPSEPNVPEIVIGSAARAGASRGL